MSYSRDHSQFVKFVHDYNAAFFVIALPLLFLSNYPNWVKSEHCRAFELLCESKWIVSMRHSFGLILKFLVLLIGLREAIGWRWTDLIRSTREDTDFDSMNNDSNETTTTTFSPTTETTTMAPPTPILTPHAIANIVSSGVAVIFLTVVLCYLMITFNQVEHRTRVRTALQRNKQIDRQIAAARARQQQQQQLKLREQEELIGEEGLKVETVGGAEDGRRLIPAAVGVVNDGETPSSNGDQESVGTKDKSKMGGVELEIRQGTKAEVVVDFEEKGSGTSSTTVDDDDKPLINIGEGDTPPNQQPVLLVQPAQPELV